MKVMFSGREVEVGRHEVLEVRLDEARDYGKGWAEIYSVKTRRLSDGEEFTSYIMVQWTPGGVWVQTIRSPYATSILVGDAPYEALKAVINMIEGRMKCSGK